MDCWDKNRRTMSEALRTGKLNDEARAFVTGTATAPNSDGNTPEVPPPASSATGEIKTPAISNGSPAHPKVAPVTPPTDVSGTIPGTVSMTFRLPAELSARLIRVSAERKVRRERPFSQQDIVIEALFDWLYQHGHFG